MSARILVIGRTGQVASALPQVLTEAGFEPILVGRPTLDLADAASVSKAVLVTRPALVINPAAYTAVDKAEDDEAAAFSANRDGARHVATAAAAIGVPIVHFSTDYVFDGTKGAPYKESDPTAPLGAYGRSKLEGEAAVCSGNPRHVILRTAWVCSPQGQNFLKTMLRLASTHEAVDVVDDQRGAPTFAFDLARACARIADNLSKAPDAAELHGIFHIASRGDTTWCGFARQIFESSKRRKGPFARVNAISTSQYPTRARRPADSRLDTSKIEAVHGIVLPDWREALEPCLDQLLNI